jgi:type I restriction enzyme S subunit
MMTSHGWKAAKLDQLGFVGRGKSRHRPRNADFLYGGPYPFFQTGDIKAAHFHLTEHSQTYSAEGLAQSKLWRAGTLCITIAANIAETAILGVDGCFPDSVVGFIADPEKADVRFIKYYMDTLKLQMQSASRGTTQDNLSLDKLLTFDFLVPDLTVQRRIADILSAYDELIENNQRRIRILETMARSLYREWFVHFRFPGHEKVRRLPSTLGKIPEGWEVVTIDDVCDRVTDGSHSSPKSVDAGMPMASSKDMNEWGLTLESCRSISREDFDELVRNGCKPRKNDVLITKDGANYLKYIFVHRSDLQIVLLSSIAILRPNNRINSHLLAATLNSPETKGRLKNYVTGAAIPRIVLKDFKQFQFVLPVKAIQARWAALAEPLTELCWGLMEQITNLRRTRDLLLPRLLSGEVFNTPNAPKSDAASAASPIASIRHASSPPQLELPSRDVGPDIAATLGRPPSIDDTDRTEMLCAIRTLFNDDQERERDAAIRELAHALGYQRTGSRVYEVLSTDLLTAVRRGIIANVGGVYRRGFRTLADCTRHSLKKDFESAIGRGWISREDAIRALARWLGFGRVGPVIDETARSLINGLIREGRLEADGSELIRRR